MWVAFLSMKRIKLSFNNCFELNNLAWQFISVIYPANVSLNNSNQDRGEKNDLYEPRSCYLMCLNNECVAGFMGLVPAHLLRSHSLHYAHAGSAVSVLSVDAISVN